MNPHSPRLASASACRSRADAGWEYISSRRRFRAGRTRIRKISGPFVYIAWALEFVIAGYVAGRCSRAVFKNNLSG